MRTFAPVLLLALTVSCSSFTWKGQGQGLTDEQKELGIADVGALQRDYETKRYWAGWRRRRDGLVNSFGSGLDSIMSTVDRHFFNYSALDPALNHPTSSSYLTHTAGFGGNLFLGLGSATVGTGAK